MMSPEISPAQPYILMNADTLDLFSAPAKANHTLAVSR
jgi:hypothetical protein